MKYINLQNPYSIYQLYKYEYGRKFLNNFINDKLNTKEEYTLLDFYNQEFNDVRSYCIFETTKSIVIIDFIDNKDIYNYLKITSNKEVYFILINNDNNENNVWFAKTKEEQEKYDSKLTSILYKMNKYIYELYLHEEELKENKL